LFANRHDQRHATHHGIVITNREQGLAVRRILQFRQAGEHTGKAAYMGQWIVADNTQGRAGQRLAAGIGGEIKTGRAQDCWGTPQRACQCLFVAWQYGERVGE